MLQFNLRKLLTRFFYSILAVLSVYWLLANLFINSSFLSSIKSLNSRELTIEIQSGWTWLPGNVHLNGVLITGADKNVKWTVFIDKFDLNIRLDELLQKKFHVTHLSGNFAKFMLEVKTKEKKKQEFWPDDHTPLSKKKNEHWKLVFDEIHLSSLDEIEIAEFKFKGNSEVHGKFFLWPGIEAEVGPASIDFKSGLAHKDSTEKGRKELIHHLVGRADVQFNKFKIDQTKGSQVFNYLNLKSKLEAKISDLSALNLYFKENQNIRFEEGRGKLKVNAFIKNGELIEQSEIHVDLPEIKMRAYRFEPRGRGVLRGKVTSNRGHSESILQLDLSQYVVSKHGSKLPLLSGSQFLAEAKTSDLELVKFGKNMFYSLQVKDAKIDSLKNWQELVNSEFIPYRLEAGRGNMSLSLKAASGEPFQEKKNPHPESNIKMDISGLKAASKTSRISGNLSIGFKMGTIDFNQYDSLIYEGEVMGKKIKYSFIPESQVSYEWFIAKLSSVHLQFGKNPNCSGDAVLVVKRPEALIKLLEMQEKVPKWVFKAFDFDPVVVGARFEVAKNSLLFNEIFLDSESVQIQGFYKNVFKSRNGAFLIQSPISSLGVSLDESDFHVHLFPNASWVSSHFPNRLLNRNFSSG